MNSFQLHIFIKFYIIYNVFLCFFIDTIFSINFLFTLPKKKLDVAVIVEPREHEYLVPVVLNIIENVPKYTKIYIFHGSKNLNFIKTHFENKSN